MRADLVGALLFVLPDGGRGGTGHGAGPGARGDAVEALCAARAGVCVPQTLVHVGPRDPRSHQISCCRNRGDSAWRHSHRAAGYPGESCHAASMPPSATGPSGGQLLDQIVLNQLKRRLTQADAGVRILRRLAEDGTSPDFNTELVKRHEILSALNRQRLSFCLPCFSSSTLSTGRGFSRNEQRRAILLTDTVLDTLVLLCDWLPLDIIYNPLLPPPTCVRYSPRSYRSRMLHALPGRCLTRWLRGTRS